MNNIFLKFILILLVFNSCTQKNNVAVLSNEQGIKLLVNGEDFIVNGMNWDYFPIGTNFSYSL